MANPDDNAVENGAAAAGAAAAGAGAAAEPDEVTPEVDTDGGPDVDDVPRPSNPPVGPSSPPRQDPRE